MDLLPTMMFQWAVSNSRLLLATKTLQSMYTDPISTAGADQIGLLVVTTPSGGTDPVAFIRIAWAGVKPDNTTPTAFVEECVETPGSLLSGVQQYSLNIKEYGPIQIGPSTRATIWLPTAAHFFKIGCYTSGNVSAPAMITIYVELGRTGAPVQQGR